MTHPAHPARPARRSLLAALAAALAASAFAQAPLPVAPPAVDAANLPAGRLVEATFVERWTPLEVQQRAGVAFGGFGAPTIENPVDLWLLRFTTTRFDGAVVVVRARAFTPVDPARGAAPLLVYGSGTTGVAAACAPSREYERATPLGYYRELLAPYAGRGVATVFPDYVGFEDADRPQAYFHAESEAHVLLDAARAMTELYARTGDLGALRSETFFGGYSQGGHAAFAVADQHRAYAPDVRVTGVMGFAATTDVEALLATAAYYAPFVLLAYRSVYGDDVDPAQVLAPRFVPTLEQDAGAFCVDRAQQVYPYDGAGTYTGAFHRALQAGDPGAVAPGFARALAANATGLSGHGLPALLVQGGQDVIVLDRTQERFVAALCDAGSAVTYLNVPTARHRDTRSAGFDASLAWLWALVNGAPAPSSCAN
ncbi:MAG: lipase family protein [Trueperaceae bacterium]